MSQAIPVIAVGYHGFKDLDRLKRRLGGVSALYRPNAVFVVDPGLFHGFGLSASGALSLYALCMVISRLSSDLSTTRPDLGAYVR